MFRTSAARVLPKASFPTNSFGARKSLGNKIYNANFTAVARSRPLKPLALAVRKPIATSLVRYQTTRSIDHDREARLSKRTIEPEPDAVTAGSSVRHVFSEEGDGEKEPEVDMSAGIKQDFKTIVDTFALKDVPREALYVGLAGVLPYLATSLSTVYLAWDINYAFTTGEGFLLSGPTAEALLHLLEPIQLGYGASIISFLGAIHWGLEWAGFGGYQGYKRYSIGVIATAVAWPTLLLSAEMGLITQFLAFTFLYYTDARAAVAGWAPPWYPTYRFVLTFIVGASIVLSLIGRGEIADKVAKAPGPADRMRALREGQLEQLEKEESERRSRIVSEDEAEEDGGDDDEGDSEDAEEE
ncbi:MAG: hypothetical protein Q9160_008853 [Pyrenula sp. 1 TL-2023]